MISTLDKVREVVLEQAPDVEVAIGPADLISRDLGIDSLAFVDILVKIEQVFGIEFTDHELATVQSVQDITDLIEQKV